MHAFAWYEFPAVLNFRDFTVYAGTLDDCLESLAHVFVSLMCVSSEFFRICAPLAE